MRLALADSFGQSTERRGRIQLTRPPPLILISIPARIHPARKFVMNVPLCQRQAATNPRDLSRRPQDGVVTSVNLLFCVLKNDPQLNSLQRTKPLGGFPAARWRAVHQRPAYSAGCQVQRLPVTNFSITSSPQTWPQTKCSAQRHATVDSPVVISFKCSLDVYSIKLTAIKLS